jgi:hypothetical protein
MIKKKLFYTKFNEIIKKKIFNKEHYQKVFSRGLIKLDNPISVLDNSSLFLNTSSSSSSGFSISVNTYKFQNLMNSFIKFNSFILLKRHNENSFLKEFYEGISSFNKVLKNKSTLFILKPIKGGFLAYSSGFCGFVPRSHSLCFFLSTFFFFFKNFDIKKVLLSLSFFNKKSLNFKKELLICRLLFTLGKITFIPSYKKRNFSSMRYKKKKMINNNINIVFLYPNYPSTENIKNEYKKIKKKND